METTTPFLPKPHPLLSSSFRHIPSTLRPRRRTPTSSLAFPHDLAIAAAALTAASLGARLAFSYHFRRRKHQDDALGGVVDRGEGKEREFRFGRSILEEEEEEGEVSEAVNKDAKRNEIDDHVRRDRDEVSVGNEMAFCSGHSVPGDDGVSEIVNTDAKSVENNEFISVDRAFAQESLDVVAPAFETMHGTSSICSEVYLGSMFTQIVGDNFMVGESSVGGGHLPLVPGYEPLGRPVGEIEMVSRPKLNFAFLSEVPRQFSLQDGLGARALTMSSSSSSSSSSSRRAQLPLGGSLIIADKPKGITPTACYRESSHGNKDESGLKRRSQYNRRRFVQKTKIMATTRHPRSDAMLFGGGRSNPKRGKGMDSSSCLRSYNRLLRDARLKECVELLEDMVTKGLLDMDKVYHTKFLKACKIQKAVEEAFRFTKLIKQPTMSTYNMLLSVCASAQDYEGAFQVVLLVKEAGLRPDCQLYTTLISTCAKIGKVEAMFEVFHEMLNAEIEPNAHTYAALIDGCARARQIAKAFGVYGIMRSKDVKPDRVIFNTLITACGQSGALDRAFDVLAEMMAEPQPIEPDHITVGALMKTCSLAGQANRAREVYKMLQQYNIKGMADVYTIAVNSCSLSGDLEFALNIYDDMKKNGIAPDEMFLSTLVDVAGHAGDVEVGFEILKEARAMGMSLGNVTYSSLMGACSNAKNWKKALELHEHIKEIHLCPTVSTLNALITSLCDGDQLSKAVEVLDQMKDAGVHPNIITYSVLLVACEKKDEDELGFHLYSQAKEDGVCPNVVMSQCLIGLCVKRIKKAHSLGEPVLSNAGKPQIDSKWTTRAVMAYRQIISSGLTPSPEALSQVLGCLKIPNDTDLRNRLVENLGLSIDTSRYSNFHSLLDGFGEYDPRSFSIFEEASSLGVILPSVSIKDGPITVDVRRLEIHTAEVYILTVLKGLKHRLAAGGRLPNVTITLPTEKTQILSSEGGSTIYLAGRVGQAVAAMMRRLGLSYQGNISHGKIRISGLTLKRWFMPRTSAPSFSGKPTDLTTPQTRLAKEITNQQRNIRSSYSVSLE